MIQAPISLGQVLDTMLNSQRLLVVEEEGKELYKGYVANFTYSTVDRSLQVKEIGLATEVLPKAKKTDRLPMKERKPIPSDDLTYFAFADMECVVYQKIVLEKDKK